MQRMKVGIVGCGNISGIYLKADKRFDILQVAAVADLDISRAQAQAKEHGTAQAYRVDELLADPEIELVINLTIPVAHYEVSRAALLAGKHVYAEKPMALTLEQGKELMKLAQDKKLSIGGAPDTFLGAGLQTCRELIDSGAIGKPVAATAFMLSSGPESWHPNPGFFYVPGAGPMFDMGPYYLTALIHLIGPIRRLTSSSQILSAERTITNDYNPGEKIKVETPSTIAGVMDFVSGAIGTITTSFDVFAANHHPIEIYGTEGSLQVPDPNTFGGPIKMWRNSEREWKEVPVTRPFADNSRGIGVADMAYALQSGRPPRASGALTLHVLEAMAGFLKASDDGCHYQMTSPCERPAALPADWPKGEPDR